MALVPYTSGEKDAFPPPPVAPNNNGLNQSLQLDLEWQCPVCTFCNLSSTAHVVIQPELSCVNCGWQGFPSLQWRNLEAWSASKGGSTKDEGRGLNNKQSKKRKVASSGEDIVADFEDQHIEAPVGGMLVVMKHAQRHKYCSDLACYSFFILTFCIIAMLMRPVHQIFEIHDSMYKNLYKKSFPGPSVLDGGPNFKQTFKDVGNWEDFWLWCDGVLMKQVYSNQYWPAGEGEDDTSYISAPYSQFTVSKYNRLLTPIRFRQVRVNPTLPQCRQESADPLLAEAEHNGACTDEPQDSFKSCSTPTDNHALSRPCWGAWSGSQQDHSYPTAFQLETAQKAKNDTRPEQDIQCKEHCHAYFNENKRGCAEWEALCEPGMYEFINSFYVPTVEDEKLEEGFRTCTRACDVTNTKQLGGLSAFAGKEDAPNFCGSGEGDGCWGDAVDLPLESEEARRLVRAMQRERWTHEGTRGLVIEINTYNANYDMATVFRIIIEQTEGGRLEPHIEVLSCRLNPYSSQVDMLRLALEVAFTFWLVWYLGVELVEMYQLRAEYLEDIWNYIELINLGIYFYTMFYWYDYCMNPELENFKKRTGTFQDLYTIAKHYNMIGLVSSFNLIWGFIRFFKYFRLYSRFAILWDALGLAMKSIIPFLFAFLLIVIAFVWSGHWLFGPRYYRFHKFGHTLMALIVSLQDGLDYDVLKEANPGPLPFWFFGWTLVSSLVLVNVLIAIITDAFAKAKEWNYRLRAQEADAIDKTRMESLLLHLFHECCPGRGDDKRPPGDDSETPQELHERSLELKSVINEVDTEKLWTRLMEGVKNGEVALDSRELAFLFNGSEKDARIYIDRLCTIGKLQRVDIPEAPSTLNDIMFLESHINVLEEHLGVISETLESSYPEMLPYLYPDLYEEVNNEKEKEYAKHQRESFLAITEGKDLMSNKVEPPAELIRSKSISVGGKSKLFRKASTMDVKRTGGMFGDHAPQRGDLKRAAQALEIKKTNAGSSKESGGEFHRTSIGEIKMDSLTSGAVDEFIASPKLDRY